MHDNWRARQAPRKLVGGGCESVILGFFGPRVDEVRWSLGRGQLLPKGARMKRPNTGFQTVQGFSACALPRFLAGAIEHKNLNLGK
jgi:hypothetical protein